jgi:hypothetical protein
MLYLWLLRFFGKIVLLRKLGGNEVYISGFIV